MTKYVATTFVLAVSLAISMPAQTIAPPNQPSKRLSIWIGMPLELGMSRDEIISKLAESYKLTKVQSTGDDWIVAEKQNAEIWQGYLGFQNAKLTYASRSWTQGDEDTFAFALAFWRAMSEMDREGRNTCTFEVPTTNSPTAEIRYVRFYCGMKRIEIMATDVLNGQAKGHQVSVNEILSSEKLR
jgi:hypothetical protein